MIYPVQVIQHEVLEKFNMAEKHDGENFREISEQSIKTEEINQMFRRIVNKTDINIKSQQRTDTDLSDEQKIQILKDIFEQNPSVFLARFGEWISVDDLPCFCAASGSEVEYAIGVLKKKLNAKRSGVCVKNRRFEALQRLEKDTSYFSEDEMQQRCPLLYEQYIGQYMTDEEKFKQEELKMKDEVKLSSFIFQQIDRDWLRKKEMEERELEECMEEEDDESDDGHEEDNKDYDEDTEGDDGNTKECNVTNINSEEKMKLREEFLNLMRQRFLEGLDEEFDYTKVDTNDEYDNLEILSQDEQDKYFDEEPEIINERVNNEEQMSTESDEDDYLSDKILEKCCASKR